MKTIGLIGGMSWESTAIYYRLMNESVRARLGGLHSAQLIMWSFDFDEIAQLQAAGDWDLAEKRMVDAAQSLKSAGAEAIVICTNTMHKLADAVEKHVRLPLLHIADATAAAIRAESIKKVGLLATRFTMEQLFYTERMETHFSIAAITPNEADRAVIHRIIYDELCQGIISAESKREYLRIIDRLIADGAEGIILGCTEIGLLISQNDVSIPLFDSTSLHAHAAVDWALSN